MTALSPIPLYAELASEIAPGEVDPMAVVRDAVLYRSAGEATKAKPPGFVGDDMGVDLGGFAVDVDDPPYLGMLVGGR